MLDRFNKFIEKWMAFVTPLCLLVGVCFPDIAKHGLPYVTYVFAFMTFTGALKSRFRDVANVIRNPGSLITIMLMLHIAIPAAACGMGHLLFPNNMNLITGMVLEFSIPTAVASMMWVSIFDGNSSLSLSLVVIDTVLAPFIIPFTLHFLIGSNVSIDVGGHDERTALYGGFAGSRSNVSEPTEPRKSHGNLAKETGTFFQDGTDVCRDFKFI